MGVISASLRKKKGRVAGRQVICRSSGKVKRILFYWTRTFSPAGSGGSYQNSLSEAGRGWIFRRGAIFA